MTTKWGDVYSFLVSFISDVIKTKTDEKFSEFLIQFDHCINEGTWQSMRTILHGKIDSSFYQIRLYLYDVQFSMSLKNVLNYTIFSLKA